MAELVVDMPGLNEGRYAGELNFIVVKVKNESGGEKLLITTGGIGSSHPGVLGVLESRLRREGVKFTAIEYLGGGQIHINSWRKPKTIKVWGDSTTYGIEPDRQQTIQAIKAAFPDWEVI